MQGLSKVIVSNNKLRKDLQPDTRARETLRKSVKVGISFSIFLANNIKLK